MSNRTSLAALCAVAATFSVAQADYVTSYTVTLDIGQPVTNIMLCEEGNGFGSMTWAFSASGDGTTELVNPFPTTEPVASSFLVGIVQDLPGDGSPDQKHAVLFMDDTAAQLSNNIAWGTLFRTTLEDQLIAAIELATSGQDWPIIQPGLDAVNAFTQGDAKNGILGPGGAVFSAWFATGGTFSVLAFSDGTVIGTGSSAVTFVPEPGALGGLLLGTYMLRRRRI